MGAWVSAVLVGASALAAGADEREERLPQPHRKWLKEEVSYIITDVEREAFLELLREGERDAFIDAFWRKRDTNPTTIENEYRDEHYRRLDYANEFFGRDTPRPGWMTDRGRYHIVLGPPAERQNYEGYDEIYPAELWFYNDPDLKRAGLPPFFYLLFFRRYGSGELELYSPLADGPLKLLSGYQTVTSDFRRDIEKAYEKLYQISPELAHASLSFRTDEGDVVQFQAPAFGTVALLEGINEAPTRGIDTSYAERFDSDRVESDYLFSYVPSWGMATLLPGPEKAHYLHWVIELDPQNVGVVKDEARASFGTVFVASAEIAARGRPDRIVTDARQETYVNLSESSLGNALRLPFAYSGLFPIVPGSYDVRIVLRNRACPGTDDSDCRKAYTVLEAPVEVPEWEESVPRLHEIVLAYGSERATSSAYRAYRFGTLDVLPNPRNAYAIGDRLLVLAEAQNARERDLLRYRIARLEAAEAGEVQWLLDERVPAGGIHLEPRLRELSLEGLDSGRYRLVVDLVDENGGVVASRSRQFDVTPQTAVVRPGVRATWAEFAPETPGSVQLALGRQYLVLGAKEKARELLETSLSANPRVPPAREALAGLLLEEGDLSAAVSLLLPIYHYMPKRDEALVLLGEAYFRQDDHEKAAEILEQAAALRPLSYRLLNFLAISHSELGHDARAIELLTRSIELQPQQPEMKELLSKLEASSMK